MKSFNLFSTATRKDAISKNLVKLPTSWAALFSVLFITFILALVIFFINTYYSLQLNNRGNYLIKMIDEQAKFDEKITILNNFDSRTSAAQLITQTKIKSKDFISKLDSLTNNSIKTYVIDSSLFNGNIVGRLSNMDDVVSITQKIKDDTLFKNVKLAEITKQDKDQYTYTILFDIDSEKI